MKKLLFLIICFLGTLAVNAQVKHVKVVRDTETPVFMINNQIIAGSSILKSIPEENFSEMQFFKDKAIGSKVLFIDQQNPGIVTLEIQKEFETKSQSEINKFFGLDSETDMYINGYLIEDKDLRLYSSSIAKVEVLEKDYLRLESKVLNISVK